MRFASLWILILLLLCLPAQAGQAVAPPPGGDNVIHVGPERAIKTIAAAAGAARAGSTIYVDSGEYVGDVAVWTQDQITVRAVGGRVKLVAGGASAESKAIWVVRGGQMSVEGFDFSDARVSGNNGAGIRFERGQLKVDSCTFTNNENGILTSNQADATLDIKNSEFGFNGYGDGQSHNLYVGSIARLTVTGSYFHHARVGHLLKSRAAENHIFYNRLTDEVGGSASYELEFPDGGIAYVVGNIIEQGSQTQNPHIISYGAEGYTSSRNELYLVNNTLNDNRPQGGIFLRVKPGDVKVKAVNNLLIGPGKLESAGPGVFQNNFNVGWDAFVQLVRDDYRLKPASELLGKAVDPGMANGVNLRPQAEYAHPRSTKAIPAGRHNPGAMQSVARASNR